MSWRTVVIGSNAKLDLMQGHMVVRKGNHVDKVFIKEIGTLIIESTAVSLTTALLSALTKHKVKIIFCDEKHNPSAELLPYYGAHDSTRKIRAQLQWAPAIKKAVWTRIVQEKIRQQAQLLERLGKMQHQKLAQYQEDVQWYDKTNREGSASKVYFGALFGLDFSRGQDNALNAALNYGYSMILSAFNREITARGYLTQLGLWHDNVYNPFNLASDLMEPFRPLVDGMVHAMHPEQFGKEEKHLLIGVLDQTVSIHKRQETVRNAVGIYAQSVFAALQQSDVSLIRFYENEL